ncbi:hypothetical protein NP493_194g08010 [Ridgeia piscesae]|uniref:Uncharacterized protein n=1 Tax=Ridgeia piscesae TaxID=27915 RepID=A0AAD9P1V5_RIDPI|nr:hypothetical protein NP493_194g08010 [Ridgeia piscesae]
MVEENKTVVSVIYIFTQSVLLVLCCTVSTPLRPLPCSIVSKYYIFAVRCNILFAEELQKTSLLRPRSTDRRSNACLLRSSLQQYRRFRRAPSGVDRPRSYVDLRRGRTQTHPLTIGRRACGFVPSASSSW